MVLFVVVIHMPQRRQLRMLSDQIHSQQDHLSEAEEKSEILIPLSRRVEALRISVGDFEKKLPGRAKIGDFLEQIVAGLKSAELLTQEIRPQSPTTQARYSELPLSLSFQGDFGNICTFLDNIENMPHLNQVKELKLETGNNDGPPVKAKMVLKIYCSRS